MNRDYNKREKESDKERKREKERDKDRKRERKREKERGETTQEGQNVRQEEIDAETNFYKRLNDTEKGRD